MNYIEQYDADSDYTFEIPELDSAGFETLEEFTESRSPEILAAITSALYNGITLDLDQVPAFAVKDSDAIINLTRDQYFHQLQRCLQYYIEFEEYEICRALKALEEKL